MKHWTLKDMTVFGIMSVVQIVILHVKTLFQFVTNHALKAVRHIAQKEKFILAKQKVVKTSNNVSMITKQKNIQTQLHKQLQQLSQTLSVAVLSISEI